MLSSACAHHEQAKAAPEAWTYTISDGSETDEPWHVELCFHGKRPSVLVASEAAGEVITTAHSSVDDDPLPLQRGTTPTINLEDLKGDCLNYGVDLSGAGARQGFRPKVRKIGKDLVVANDLWLWHPRRVHQPTQITAEFRLDGGRVSTPWASDGQGRFVLPRSALYWGSYTALGDLTIDTLAVAGGTLEIVILDAPHRLSREGARRWLQTAGEAAATLYGKLPVPHLRALVLPVGATYDPVVFGSVERGGASVFLLISSEAEDDDFYGEWVAIHEFLHLGMPFIDRNDAWLPKGFVTYYTEVVRARMGLRSEAAAWHALL
ncbi:MAG TPA: hypothetical protein ENK31_03520, partial [Nannocystis exedens]|nr:hypothetical protein [Nannocystis exedens]